jgi:uncharacterized protein (DUF1697 family)
MEKLKNIFKNLIMKKYIAFLRGINVGNIRIKMPDLTTAFKNMGFEAVKTYLQTGNVVFESDKTMAEIKTILEKGLSETFHYEAFVLLYEFNFLAEIIAQYPHERGENHHAYVVFVDNEIIFEDLKSFSEKTDEPIILGNQVIYWKVVKGESLETPFSKIIAKAKYKKNTTVRNINTLEKMVEG